METWFTFLNSEFFNFKSLFLLKSPFVLFEFSNLQILYYNKIAFIYYIIYILYDIISIIYIYKITYWDLQKTYLRSK